MEWYITLSLVASAIGILCALIRLCLCSLACCEGDQENVVPYHYQTTVPYTISASQDQQYRGFKRERCSSPQPPPYPGAQFPKVENLNSNARPTPYTMNQSFTPRYRIEIGIEDCVA